MPVGRKAPVALREMCHPGMGKCKAKQTDYRQWDQSKIARRRRLRADDQASQIICNVIQTIGKNG